MPSDGVHRIGIVGSRRRNTLRDRRIVFDIVERLAPSLFPGQPVTIVSGGCKGPDSFAAEAARFYKLDTKIFPVPTDPPIQDRNDFRERAYARNTLIAEASEDLYALVAPDRKGGTEDTIRKAHALRKNVFLVDEEGAISYLSPEAKS